MTDKAHSLEQPESPSKESATFLKHMACRLFLGLWALVSALTNPLDKAVIALIALGGCLGIVETIFRSLEGWARLRDEQEKARLIREAQEAKKEEKAQLLKKAQAESAASYFS